MTSTQRAAAIAALFKRDGLDCWLCRREINPALQYPDKLSMTIDHVIEQRNGGADDLENLRLAHNICNSTRDRLFPQTAGPRYLGQMDDLYPERPGWTPYGYDATRDTRGKRL